MIKFINKNYNKLLLVIIITAALLRFYQLGIIPAGLTNDEANIGYDAFSIYHTGRDQWGQSLPLISFKGFGDYRPVLYTYLVVPVIPLFGLTSFAVRFPGAIFSVLSVISLYLILKKLFSKRMGLAGSVLLAISPWSIGLGRLGLESNVALTFLLAGIFMFLNIQKKIVYLYFSVILFTATLYTYAGYVLLSPLVFLTLLVFYRKLINKFKIEIIISIVVFVLLCLPLFIKNDATAKIRFSQIGFMQNVTSTGIINELNDQRGECLKVYPSVICKLAFNKVSVFGGTILKNYIAHFSVNFLYINGNETQYSVLPQRGLFYIFEVFLLSAGIIWIARTKKKESYLLLALLLLSAVPDTITGPGHYSRAFVMLPFFISIEALGFTFLLSIFDNQKINFLKIYFILFLTFILTGSTVMFVLNYNTYFKVFYSRFSSFGYEELMKYVYDEKNNYSRIYITNRSNDTKQYVYYLFYNNYDPMNYQRKNNVEIVHGSDGWVKVRRIENIYFVDALPIIDSVSPLAKEKILFISAPTDFPGKVKPKKYIRDLKKDVLFESVPLQEYLRVKSLHSIKQ